MKKTTIFLDDNVLQELGKLPGTTSEHIRTAIDKYLESIHNVSTSPSGVTIVEEEVYEIYYPKEGDSNDTNKKK